MTAREKVELVERVLDVQPGCLTEGTQLSTLEAWDSLAILNLQIELSAVNPDVQFDSLYTCNTVGDICAMI